MKIDNNNNNNNNVDNDHAKTNNINFKNDDSNDDNKNIDDSYMIESIPINTKRKEHCVSFLKGDCWKKENCRKPHVLKTDLRACDDFIEHILNPFSTPNCSRENCIYNHPKKGDLVNPICLIIQVLHSHKDRVVDYLNHQYSDICKIVAVVPGGRGKRIHPWLVLLQCVNFPKQFPVLEYGKRNCESHSRGCIIETKLSKDEVLCIGVNRFYKMGAGGVTHDVDDLIRDLNNNIIKKISSTKEFEKKKIKIRIRGYPRELETICTNILGEKVDANPENCAFDLVPANFDFLLSIVYASRCIFYGLEKVTNMASSSPNIEGRPNKIINKDSEGSMVICRAYYKLKEVFSRCNLINEDKRSLVSEWIGVDIGSSPGGWTSYLAHELKLKKVFAVDPGAMDPKILALPNVTHVQNRIQHVTQDLLNDDEKFNVVVSDMNVPHDVVIDCFKSLVKSDLIADNALVVLTMKNFMGGKKKMEDYLKVSIVSCTPFAQEEQVQCLHLMMNGLQERTIVFRFKKR